MKSIPSILLLAICLVLGACQSEPKETGTQIGALHISDATPNQGEKLNFSYQAEADTDVLGYYYYLVGDEIHAQDLTLKDSARVYRGTFTVPDSATAIAFRFKTGESFDSNDKKGFTLPVHGEDEKPVPGAKASQSYFYWALGNRVGLSVEEEALLSGLKKDVKQHPQIAMNWDQFHARLLSKKDQKAAKQYIGQRLPSYTGKKNLSQENYATLAFFYKMLKNKAKLDSVNTLIEKKFPEGKMAQRSYFMTFNKAAGLPEKEVFLKNYDAKFTGEQFFKDPMTYSLANTYFDKGNTAKFFELADKIENNRLKARLFNGVAWNKAEKGADLEFAANVSKKSLEAIAEEKKALADKPDLQTEHQYLTSLGRSYGMFADTYAFILFQQGKIEEAVHYQEIAVGEGENSEINERYLQYLLAAKKYNAVEKLGEEYIKKNGATAKAKSYYKKAYVENHGSEKGLEAKMSQLEKTAHDKALAEVKKQMIDEPAPAFTLTDLKGNEVSLASLKGKTVILDFWATWCGPCKASFPGMQKAVEKYSDNPKVAFFFVNTFESAASPQVRKAKVGGFITRKKYDFHVLLDQPVKEGARQFKTASDYGITGIPTKIIIGPNGNIKFKKVGYGGNNLRMLQEIEMMIELSQTKS